MYISNGRNVEKLEMMIFNNIGVNYLILFLINNINYNKTKLIGSYKIKIFDSLHKSVFFQILKFFSVRIIIILLSIKY